ncbi:unnamed protein product, partial [Tuber aestivum]
FHEAFLRVLSGFSLISLLFLEFFSPFSSPFPFTLFTRLTKNTIASPRELYYITFTDRPNILLFCTCGQHIGRTPFSLAPASEREDSRANLHHPRVASVLGVARCYHVPLIICRGLSVWPSLIGLSRCAVAFVATEGLGCTQVELILAVIWCFSSAYLSYLFINNLMARWLIYYTPPGMIPPACTRRNERVNE